MTELNLPSAVKLKSVRKWKWCLPVTRVGFMSGHPVLLQAEKVHRTRWHQLNLSQVGSRKRMGASAVSILFFRKPVTDYISGRQ